MVYPSIIVLTLLFLGNCEVDGSQASNPSASSRQVQVKRQIQVEKRYTDQGELLETESYYIDSKGKKVLHGPQVLWHSNGRKVQEINYVDGQRHGLQTEWTYIDGTKIEEGRWEHDSRIGPWIEWHSTGEKASECTYNKEGQIEGTKQYWNNGMLVREDRYDGHSYLLEITVWNRNKTKRVHGTFCEPTEDQIWLAEPPKDGRWTYWDQDGSGKVIAEGVWKKGKPWSGVCGEPTGRSMSGTLDIYSLRVGQYKDGKLIKELKLTRPTKTPNPPPPKDEKPLQPKQ